MSTPRPVPARPNLEFDRKQAKALLSAAERGEPDAVRRFAAHHPAPDGRAFELHDALLVIAREYGFRSWPRWKQYVEWRLLDRGQRAAEFVKAACSHDVRKARRLLQSEPDLASFDLYTACVSSEAETVEHLTARDPALASHKGGPLGIEPILYACFSRLTPTTAVARVLLDRGANPNASYWIEGEKRWLQTTLYGAAGIANNVELTTALLDAGATFDPQDEELLYHTTEFADPTCLGLIFERATPPRHLITYCLGRTLDFEYPVHVAMFLTAGADPDYRSTWYGARTHLHKAVYFARSVEIVRLLVDAGADVNATDENGISILRSAVRNGDAAVIALLREHGAHDDQITEADALRGDPMTLCRAASRGDVPTIQRLLDAGAEIDGPGARDGMTPLHCAAWNAQFDAVRRLVERGADLHRRNTYGGDALGVVIHGSQYCDHVGPEAADIYPRLVDYLVARGATLPEHIDGGSDVVQEVLRRHGVPDAG